MENNKFRESLTTYLNLFITTIVYACNCNYKGGKFYE